MYSITYDISQKLKAEREERRWIKTNIRWKSICIYKKVLAGDWHKILKFKEIAHLQQGAIGLQQF